MPVFDVLFYRTRPETAMLTVEADCADDICISESEVEDLEWEVDPVFTHEFEQMSVEEIV